MEQKVEQNFKYILLFNFITVSYIIIIFFFFLKKENNSNNIYRSVPYIFANIQNFIF
jgi:hypothetical protein